MKDCETAHRLIRQIVESLAEGERLTFADQLSELVLKHPEHGYRLLGVLKGAME